MTIDLTKQLVELAVTSGRGLQSSQTGLIHYCKEAVDEEIDHTIPLYENFLFAYALMRTRTQQNVLEARALISRLLPFQLTDGNFPLYLHDFPQGKDRFAAVHFIVPCYYLLRDYATVLSIELKEKLEESTKRLLSFVEPIQEAPFQIRIKLAGAYVAFGKLWQNRELEEKGNRLLHTLVEESKSPSFGTWFSPVYIAETLIGLQLAGIDWKNSDWNHFWNYLSLTWHPTSRAYTGPAVKVLQKEQEPETTLYDLFLGELTGGYPYHAFNPGIIQVQGAIVQPFQEPLPPSPAFLEGEVAGHPWRVVKQPQFAYSAIDVGGPLPPELKKGFHPFRLVFGDENQVFSLIGQGGLFTSWRTEPVENGANFYVLLGEKIEEIGSDKVTEVQLFTEQNEGLDILIDGRPSTTFQLGQEISLSHPLLKYTLRFTLAAGDGRFFGHLMPANRPSQVALKGKNRFAAYDWQLFLRTVRRQEPCEIKIEWRIR